MTSEIVVVLDWTSLAVRFVGAFMFCMRWGFDAIMYRDLNPILKRFAQAERKPRDSRHDDLYKSNMFPSIEQQQVN